MLPRPLSEIYENLRDFVVAISSEEVVGCASLHILWADLAEIKGMAVAGKGQGQGIGTILAKECLEEAKRLEIPTVFCLTYRPSFFERLGFRRVDVIELPRKVWGECQRCPKFPQCDEIALILHLEKDRSVFSPSLSF
jgi:amino-acid N-acetyltransferase